MSAAQSLYRQVRVTITEEAGGWLTVRVMAKPVDASWSLKHSVWHHRWRIGTATHHWTSLVAVALRAILGETLDPPD